MLSAVIWNPNPEILPLGPFSLRWYGLLFASGFVIGYLIFQRFIRKEGLAMELLDKLTMYMAVGTVIGARLGHCLFYDPRYYLGHPLEILKIWEGGLASHGAGIGILISLWLFVRKYKLSYLWVLDRIVITVALAGMLIRTGNLMNSEIYGVATHTTSGFMYMRHLTADLKTFRQVEKVNYSLPSDLSLSEGRYIPVDVHVLLGNQVRDEATVKWFLDSKITPILQQPVTEETDFMLPASQQPEYKIEPASGGKYLLTVRILGVPKYPTQIIEASAYLFVFVLLLGLYLWRGTRIFRGVYFALFLILVFGARFVIEYYKEVQEAFEHSLPLDMGQILSIPFVLAGFFLLFMAWKQKKPSVSEP